MLGCFSFYTPRFSNGSFELTLFTEKSYFEMFNLALYSRKNCCYVSMFYRNYTAETQNQPIWYIFRPSKIIILPELSYLNSIFKIFPLQECAFNPFQPKVVFHIKTSHFFCSAKQMTGFYMKYNIGGNVLIRNVDEGVGAEAYPESSKNSKITFFANITNNFQSLTFFVKTSILDVWLCSLIIIISHRRSYTLVKNDITLVKKSLTKHSAVFALLLMCWRITFIPMLYSYINGINSISHQHINYHGLRQAQTFWLLKKRSCWRDLNFPEAATWDVL